MDQMNSKDFSSFLLSYKKQNYVEKLLNIYPNRREILASSFVYEILSHENIH